MSHLALVLAHNAGQWTGREMDLNGIEDLDGLAEELRDVADDGTALFFLEEDDEYVAIVRVDGEQEPRAFISDHRAIATSALAGMLMADVVVPDELDESDDDAPHPEADVAGDTDIVATYGIGAAALVDLIAEEGMLPSDVVTAIAEKAGCLDVLDDLRGT